MENVYGIPNMGNTCYISTILLALFHNIPMNNFFRKINKTNNVLGDAFKTSFLQYHDNNLDTPKFIVLIKKVLKQYNNIDQNDADSFLLDLLDYLHEHLPRCFEDYRIQFKNDESKNIWGSRLNIISETFQGQHVSVIGCKDCGHELRNYQNFYQLEIPLNGSVEDCFNELFTEEKLTEYKCDNCKKENSTKLHQISIFPITLIFLIKRFNKKNTTSYQTILRINDIQYELYAITNHTGSSLNSGHYTTFLLHKNEWYHINDESINKVNLHFDYAYILFYKIKQN